MWYVRVSKEIKKRNFQARADADTMPYQYSRDMRGEKTLQFYKNLNLEACIWEFENWFHMSELQQACGGEITTDGQVHASTNQKSKTQLKTV